MKKTNILKLSYLAVASVLFSGMRTLSANSKTVYYTPNLKNNDHKVIFTLLILCGS